MRCSEQTPRHETNASYDETERGGPCCQRTPAVWDKPPGGVSARGTLGAASFLGSFSFLGAASFLPAPASFLGGVNFMGCSHSFGSPSTAANAGWCASVSHQRVTCG